MKKTFYAFVCILAVAAMTLSGCKKDNGDDTNTPGGDIQLDDNGNAVHNGSGTVTIDGVEYAINVARLQEYSYGEEQNAALTLYTEYAPNSNSFQGVKVQLTFQTTLANTGNYVSDESGDVYMTIELDGNTYKGYTFTNEIHFTRNSDRVTIEASQDNAPGADGEGHDIHANISVSYSGPYYYTMWNY